MKKLDMAGMGEVMAQVFLECGSLREAGQKEYAHRDESPFRNFESIGQEVLTILEGLYERKGNSIDLTDVRKVVLWIYFRKHLDGIAAHIGGHTSQRENVRGRINDAIVYLTLLRGMVEEEDPKNGRYARIAGAQMKKPDVPAGAPSD